MNNAIDYFAYDNPFIKWKTFFSCRARKKMFVKFEREMHPKETDEVLDLGVTPDTKLVDSNFFEKLYPYKNKITIASIEDCAFLVKKYGLKNFIQNQSKKPLPFPDGAFDILFCSAVLEHVGTREEQKFFLEECLRVSKKVFITTPNRYFPIEMHTFLPFLHWLPWSVFQKIVRRLKGEFWADINNLNLVSGRDIKEMFGKEVFSVSYVKTLGWNSNLVLTGGKEVCL
ncbi:MAG: class I SAM-dependent methyltransferase [Lachnospiraceae bacterium]|nr:class I SAM-dependent methyltransferase [Lachnospiraceae bacterium]